MTAGVWMLADWTLSQLNFGSIASLGINRYAEAMGRLWGSLVTCSVAVLFASVLLAPRIFPRWEEATQIVGGLVLGAVASVVLYAL